MKFHLDILLAMVTASLAPAAIAAAPAKPTAARPAAKSAPAPAPDGKQLYDRWCTPCHSPSYRASGTSALGVKYGKDVPAVLEQRTDLTPEIVTYFVRNGISIMPFFRKAEITDGELAAISDYLTRKKPAKR